VNLQAGTSSGGHAAGDTLVSIENLTGSSYADSLTGNSGNNTLDGGGGADIMRGGAGWDVYVVDNVGDIVDEGVAGSDGSDSVLSSIDFNLADTTHVKGTVGNLTLTGTGNIDATGNALDNALNGNSGANVLIGETGRDVLNGGAGNDTLTGGADSDTFFFNSVLNGLTNVDQITDFSAVADTISLDNAIFTALTATGTLSSAAFRSNSTGQAQDGSDRIIYETDTGELYYDADGNGAGASIEFATLTGLPTISNADFVIV
jgi:Ca2+-binding RTX toxin-like protein